MATTIKAQMSKFMIVLAMAVVASLFCAGSAFASVTVDVTFPNPDDSGNAVKVQSVQLDVSGVQNSAAAPVVGMFKKADTDGISKWNVLVTGTAAAQYASWNNVLDAAILKYNVANHGMNTADYITRAQVNALATNQSLSLEALDGKYKKYYPDAVDLDGTSTTGAGYFFNKATNLDTTLDSTLLDSTYTLISGTLNGTNPNGVGAVFAWQYAADKAQTIIDEDEGTTTYETAGTAAARAASNVASATAAANPRLIMGCPIGSTESFAMGKRYCTDITAITLS